MSSSWISVVLNPATGALVRDGSGDTDREATGGRKQSWEGGDHKPRDVWSRRSWTTQEGPSSGDLGGSTALPHRISASLSRLDLRLPSPELGKDAFLCVFVPGV